MLKAALLVSVLAACATDGIEVEHATPTTPIAATPTSVVGGHDIIVATGGALAVAIADKTAIGLSGDASAGYAVSPYEVDRWPNTISQDYLVHANVAGTGSYEIITSKGIATGIVCSADIASVSLRPASYQLDGHSPFALSAGRTEIEAVLADASGRRLVDATLAIGAGLADQTAWDRATLASIAGQHAVELVADSLPARTLAIDVVDGPVRIESVRLGDRTCFHAYAGDVEVAVGMRFSGGTADATATNCAIATEAVSVQL